MRQAHTKLLRWDEHLGDRADDLVEWTMNHMPSQTSMEGLLTFVIV